MAPRVLITREPPGSSVDRISEVADVFLWDHDRPIDTDVLAREAASSVGIYCMLTDAIDRNLLMASPKLEVVSTMAVGVDNIDLDACRELGIVVGHTPGVLTESTADMAWALLMAASRRLEESINYVQQGRWEGWELDGIISRDVSGTTIGIVGMGRIGQAIARRAEGFDMEVLFTNRSRVSGAVGTQVDLEELLGRSDHVVIAVSLNEQTRGMISTQQFAMMKTTANLVNIARGPIVDTDALVAALVEGQIRCAGLDVTDPEPIPVDHPLVALPNCLIVPHLGSATDRTRVAMADLATDNLLAALSGADMPARTA
ncbi:MAG: 2-hydroxyacid dehydrogenase [Acidimicrobiia bacterium]